LSLFSVAIVAVKLIEIMVGIFLLVSLPMPRQDV